MPGIYIIFVGNHVCDCSELHGKLVDLSPGARRKLRSEKKGFANMVRSLMQTSPQARAAAGIPGEIYEEFLSANLMVQRIDQSRPNVWKMAEVLDESRAFYVDMRENRVGIMVDMMRSRAKRLKNTSILAPFEDVLDYHGQQASRAARTRKQAKARQQQQQAEQAKAAASKGNSTGGGSDEDRDAPASARAPVSKRVS